jgi:hypothetical protein
MLMKLNKFATYGVWNPPPRRKPSTLPVKLAAIVRQLGASVKHARSSVGALDRIARSIAARRPHPPKRPPPGTGRGAAKKRKKP